ncbi:F0F1 ATP synthase subunit A [Pyruvatibacter mobilis]|jgi:F-type H+-transporting ATPase subunit a|uniref:ATP synthase subunit a n=1 Tax=Pyruvatibacter mobilis TaxID=1712261 RepID=A0A845QCB6_9HYPH|nr:F0F1 ATP synthase subunit A [Pyruvatibacter mobilis]NBG96232.1 F0F1 ATP synthase subunit A [Pyruvatibacter mobilis]QJD75734.1 F0F1 ATP synthase subunit A [Pyruvatibacter mobilis]GGD18121.1 ATP synthase subunit a [Pyruvatibacter mobilis]
MAAPAEPGAFPVDPMHQYEIVRLLPIELAGFDASFTNSAMWMVASVAAISIFMIFSVSSRALVPGRWQSMAELSYEFVANMLRQNTGSEGQPFFPFVFSLFMFILFANMFGLLPYSFTVTSHIAITFAIALFVIVGITLIGLFKHGLGWFKLFVPSGVPVVLLPLISVIELISYLTRPLSLSVRLFANMLAGHTMLKVFAGFAIMLGWAGVAPWAFMVAFTGLEVLVAFLQAYVFAILTCIYLNDALHVHH